MGVEKFLGRILHLLLFCRGDLRKGGAMMVILTVFYLGEENLVVFGRNEIDFVGFSLEILSYYGVPL